MWYFVTNHTLGETPFLLRIWFFPTHGDSFLMAIWFVCAILCLFRFLMKDRKSVKWASWPPITVKCLTD